MHRRESQRIVEAGVRVQLINGRYDPIATPFWARRTARRLHCDATFTGASGAQPTLEGP